MPPGAVRSMTSSTTAPAPVHSMTMSGSSVAEIAGVIGRAERAHQVGLGPVA